MIGKQARISLKYKLIFLYITRVVLRVREIYSKRRVTKGFVAYSPGFGTKIHARTVSMDLHFVEPGKNTASSTRVNGRLVARGKRSPGAINGRSLQP